MELTMSSYNLVEKLPPNAEYVLWCIVDGKRYQILSTNDIRLAQKASKVIYKNIEDCQQNLKIYDNPFKKDRFVYWFEDEISKIDGKLFNRITAELDRQKVSWDYC